MSKLNAIFAVPCFAIAFASMACAANTHGPEEESDIASMDAEAVTKMCGGIAGLTCPKGYDCKLTSHMPDAAGTCHKHSCVQTGVCAISAHFDHTKCACVPNVCVDMIACVAGSHWDSALCTCVKSPTCLTLTCASGSHCEMKGINGGSIAVCIANPTNTCAKAGGDCVALSPGSCDGTVGDARKYSCGSGLGVECCFAK